MNMMRDKLKQFEKATQRKIDTSTRDELVNNTESV